MKLYPTPIVDLMGDVVTKVNAAILPQLQQANSSILSVRYMYGHPLEIEATLMERTRNPGSKDGTDKGKADMWPVIILFTDIPHQMGSGQYGADVTLQMAIAMATKSSYKAADREAANFKPILYPLYEELFYQIDRSASFVTQSSRQIKHTKTERYFWGKSAAGSTFNDFLDAIEISNLQLKINFQKTKSIIK